MIIGITIVSIFAFLVTFWIVKVVPASLKAMNVAVGAMKDLSNKDLDDDAKEKATQKAALSLMGSVISIVVRCAISVIAAAIPIYGAAALGIMPAKDTIEFLSRWDVIIISSTVIMVLYSIRRRLWLSK